MEVEHLSYLQSNVFPVSFRKFKVHEAFVAARMIELGELQAFVQ